MQARESNNVRQTKPGSPALQLLGSLHAAQLTGDFARVSHSALAPAPSTHHLPSYKNEEKTARQPVYYLTSSLAAQSLSFVVVHQALPRTNISAKTSSLQVNLACPWSQPNCQRCAADAHAINPQKPPPFPSTKSVALSIGSYDG